MKQLRFSEKDFFEIASNENKDFLLVETEESIYDREKSFYQIDFIVKRIGDKKLFEGSYLIDNIATKFCFEDEDDFTLFEI